MKILGIIDEDFINYKIPSMIIEMPYCDFKCNKECGYQVCQNTRLGAVDPIEVEIDYLIQRYEKNTLTDAIVFQGLEPFDSFDDVLSFIHSFRTEYAFNDDIVIYTGYYKEEVAEEKLHHLARYPHIIIKWGRYIPNQVPHFDETLGVNLVSDNQFAQKIS